MRPDRPGWTPERPWTFVAGSFAALLGLATGWFLLWYGPFGGWADRLGETQGGAIAALVLDLPFWVLVTVGLLKWGAFRPGHLGLRRSALPSAVAVVAGVWALLQGVELVATLLAGDGPAVRLGVLDRTHGVAPFVAGLLAVALGEEIFFRGFLQTQLYLKARGRGAAVLAVVGAAVLFTVAHLPRVALTDRADAADLVPLLVLGLVVGAVYQATGNLFICVGLHALANWPVLVLSEALRPTPVLAVLAASLAGLGVAAGRRRTPRAAAAARS